MPDDLIRRSDAKAKAKCAVHFMFDNFLPAAVDLFKSRLLDELDEGLDFVPAAGAGEKTGEPKPERTPMLLARRCTGMGGIWVWMTRREADWSCQWHGSDDCDYKSRDLMGVDRTASDEAALKLYDADLTSRPDAAKEQ